MKRLMIVLMVLVSIVLVNIQCEISSDSQQQKQTEQLLKEVQREIGLPNIVNFQQKKLLKMVFELCDKENLITYAYIKSDYQGKLVFIGKCIGYGIPFSAQYTNPMKIVNTPNRLAVPQADPNALYMPVASSATWLLMIDPKTKDARPVYIEPEIVVSPFRLH